MRIGFVGLGRQDRITGGLIYNRRLVEHLRACGDDVEIIDLQWRGYGRALLENWSGELRRRLAQPVDVILESEFNHVSLILPNRRVTTPKVSLVHHLTSSEPRDAWKNAVVRAFERQFLTGVDALIYNSESTRGEVEALAGREYAGVVAYPGADRLAGEISAAEIAARAAEPGRLRLLYAGNLVARKGLAELLEAIRDLPAATTHLTVAGSADLEPAYGRRIERLITQWGLQERVTLLGGVSDAALERCYRECQLLVVPSVLEGYGMVYAEGMGFGLPSISAAAGARAIIEPGVNGYIVQPGDAEQLRQDIARLAEDRRLLTEMSLAAKERFARLPTWRETTAKVREFLVKVTSNR